MLLGFKKRFKSPIQLGTKVFTMRKKRKREPKIGETMYMYTGLRTNQCEKISDKEKLKSTQNVTVFISQVKNQRILTIKVDSRHLTYNEIRVFVGFDGFSNIDDFIDYWLASELKTKSKIKTVRITATLTLFHWTDLRY